MKRLRNVKNKLKADDNKEDKEEKNNMKDEKWRLKEIKTDRENGRQYKRNQSRRLVHFRSGTSTKAERRKQQIPREH